MSIFSIFGFGKNEIKTALRSGAIIIDVRTSQEYDEGKIRGSINIPIDRIYASIERIRHMDKPIVLCCNSGSRSAKALSILRANGLTNIYNGGSWESVLRVIHSL